MPRGRRLLVLLDGHGMLLGSARAWRTRPIRQAQPGRAQSMSWQRQASACEKLAIVASRQLALALAARRRADQWRTFFFSAAAPRTDSAGLGPARPLRRCAAAPDRGRAAERWAARAAVRPPPADAGRAHGTAPARRLDLGVEFGSFLLAGDEAEPPVDVQRRLDGGQAALAGQRQAGHVQVQPGLRLAADDAAQFATRRPTRRRRPAAVRRRRGRPRPGAACRRAARSLRDSTRRARSARRRGGGIVRPARVVVMVGPV